MPLTPLQEKTLRLLKVLALAGRDEPRDFVDCLYLDEQVLPLGALIWAASGKDPGLNPRMLLVLLRRKGRFQPEDFARLDLVRAFDPVEAKRQYSDALDRADDWIGKRPSDEAGCLYVDPRSERFFAPGPQDPAEVHRGQPGGVFPQVRELMPGTFIESPEVRTELERFFARRMK